MPAAMQYPMDLNSNEGKQIEQAFTDEHNERLKQIERNWAYYEGRHKKPLKQQKDGYDDNVTVNQVGQLAERITGLMIGDGITFDAGESEQADAEVNALWNDNRGDILKESLILGGAIEGHSAVRLLPGAERGEYPKLTRIKQIHFAAFWNPFDTSDVLWYRLQHLAGMIGKRIDYVRGQLVEGEIDHTLDGWFELVYDTTDYHDVPGTQPRWTLRDAQPWEYDWPPLVDWQNLPNNNGYYGRNDISEAIALNDALNFILSNAQRIVKHHADPKTVGTGFTAQELVQTAVGGFFTVANEAAKIYNLEMQSDNNLVRWLTEIITGGLWQSGGMVDNTTVKDLVGQLTNFGLRVLFANAIKKTQKKRLLYSEAFEEIGQHGLELAGKAVPETIVTLWPDVLPDDDAYAATLLNELQNGIISRQTYRNLRGYDHEGEEDRLFEERQAGDVGASILDLIAGNRAFNRGV
jgi:hypothetical protein